MNTPDAATICFRSRWHATVLLGMAAMCGHADSSGSMEARLTVAQGTLSRNEPVLATLYVRNRSDKGMYLDLGWHGEMHVNVRVVDPQGASRYATALDARACVDCLHQSMVDELAGGQEVAAHLVLGRWHRFAAPGRYKVYVELPRVAFVDRFANSADRVETSDGEVLVQHTTNEGWAWLEEPVLRSNTVTVDVGPRDEARLRTVANALWQRAKENDYAAQSALAWMVDPVAVPSLVQLLRGDYDSYFMDVMAAAERAATPEAVDVLLGLFAGDAISRNALLRSLRDIAQDDSAEPLARQRAEGAIRKHGPK